MHECRGSGFSCDAFLHDAMDRHTATGALIAGCGA